MKTNTFNFNRLGLLFKRYFVEHSRYELIYWCIMLVVFMLFRNQVQVIVGLTLITGAFYAARYFKEIHYPNSGAAYFMIPATQLEKLTVGIIITTFYYFSMMMIFYALGNLLGTFFNNYILANINAGFFKFFSHSPMQWVIFDRYDDYHMVFNAHSINYLTMVFLQFIFAQQIYFLGGIYFKRNQTLVTTLAVIVIFIIMIFCFGLIAYCFNNTKSQNTIDSVGIHILNVFYYLAIPYLWVVSYFRLTEKQV